MANAIKQFHATPQGQKHLFHESAENLARANETFLHLAQSGMTRSDLERCIKLRPALWGRYEAWLSKLPTERPEQQRAA